MIKRAVLLFACATPVTALAIFDGSHPLLCAPGPYHQCTADGCERMLADAVGGPRFIRIDVEGATIESVEGGAGRTSVIDHAEHVDGRLVLQGVEDGIDGVRDGLGYSISIDEASGEMVFSAAADGASFTAFGACTSASY